jgi:protein pelota
LKIFKIDRKKGFAKVMPENLDDLWHLYNIILEKDKIFARTTRQKKPDDQYARPVKAKRVTVNLGLIVEKISWDRILNRLRVNGIVCEAPESLSIKGSRHTINIIVNKPLKILKKKWPKHHIDRLKKAAKFTVGPIVIIAIDDEGYSVAVLRQYGFEIKAGARIKLPGKLAVEKRNNEKLQFFNKALKALYAVWVSLHSPIVILGLGYFKDDFADYVKKEAEDIAESVVAVKGVNSTGLSGIQESLRSGILTFVLQNMRVIEEMKIVEELLTRIGKGKGDVTYGFSDVRKATGYGAIEKLLVADKSLRDNSDEERIALETIMQEIENKGGEIFIISTENEAGIKLSSLGGIAALLRFPIS